MQARCSSTRYANSREKVICLANIDLFQWWAATISAGSTFLVIVGAYLYLSSRKRRKDTLQKGANSFSRLLKDFVFVWVLLGLLVFYIVSVDLGSDWIFAAGNIIVELVLLVYLLRNRTRE
jgi:hypothetical protein